MARNRSRERIPRVEQLETRLKLSMTVPANSIGTAVGDVTAPGAVTATAITVDPKNLTQGKSSTLFGIFVQPEPGSSLAPRIVAVEGSNGHRIPLKQGRPYVADRDSGQAAAFVKVSRPGPLTILVSGQHHSTGPYETDTTLVGDINGEGTVSLSDLQAFASSYLSVPGDPNYDLAADFNHDGIVNQVDAKALMQNMPALTPNVPLELIMNLAPADQVRFAASQNSGGSTMKQNITIEGHTMPGSIVLEDNQNGYYKWDGGAVATNAQGNFTVTEKNTQGVNTYNFLIIDPYGRQLIRSYPVFWIQFAAPRSPLK
jgi:Dockerin type I domain